MRFRYLDKVRVTDETSFYYGSCGFVLGDGYDEDDNINAYEVELEGPQDMDTKFMFAPGDLTLLSKNYDPAKHDRPDLAQASMSMFTGELSKEQFMEILKNSKQAREEDSDVGH